MRFVRSFYNVTVLVFAWLGNAIKYFISGLSLVIGSIFVMIAKAILVLIKALFVGDVRISRAFITFNAVVIGVMIYWIALISKHMLDEAMLRSRQLGVVAGEVSRVTEYCAGAISAIMRSPRLGGGGSGGGSQCGNVSVLIVQNVDPSNVAPLIPFIIPDAPGNPSKSPTPPPPLKLPPKSREFEVERALNGSDGHDYER